MGCNCGKKKKPQPKPQSKDQKKSGGTQTFELQTTSGRTLTYGSELEANAANARSGGTGTVRPVG